MTVLLNSLPHRHSHVQGYKGTTSLHVQEILQKYSYIILRRNTHKPRGTTMVYGQIPAMSEPKLQ